MTRSILLATACLGLALLPGCGRNSDSGAEDVAERAETTEAQTVKGLRNVAAVVEASSEETLSEDLFGEMYKVISHPRCMNCHPRGDSPTQGDEMIPHNPPVSRGPANFGMPGMNCTTCHGPENVSLVGGGSIPGHEPWHLPPVEQGWQGLSITEICEQIKDESRNGGKSMAELHEHNAADGLVGWGWHPGEGREPAPGNQQIFGELTLAWIDSGAACPAAEG